MSISPFVLGVDGGGTKTVAWLAPFDDGGSGTILGRGQAGPGNPRAAGFETAQANIAAAIGAAFANAKLPQQTVAAVCFGLAGAGRAAEQEQIVAWAISRGIAAQVKVTSDAEPILAAASPDSVGVVLICGTGSLAWGRNAAGKVARCGGWGYLLGDEGSGYAIALAGLRAAVRAADGRGPPSDLLPAFLRELGAASPEELVGKVYAPEMTRERLAGLASIVFDYRSTDQAAAEIVAASARDLAELARTVAAQLSLSSTKYTLAMSGGVLLHQLNYADQFLSALFMQLHGSGSRPDLVVSVEEPVRGSVALARALVA